MPAPERLATVVVCEHDKTTLDLLCSRLASDRFESLSARTAEEALRLCRHHPPDLLVIELGLPDGAGAELLRRVREAHWLQTRIDPYVPVLVLRPRGEGPEDHEADLLADAHFDKPFTCDDLRSRIDAILRRRHSRVDESVRVGELSIDPARRKVTVGDREVRLTRTEFTLLRVLAGDPTRVFAKGGTPPGHLGPARPHGKGPDPRQPRQSTAPQTRPGGGRFVVNCWGIGYRLVDSVEGTEALSDGGGKDR